VKEYIQAQKAKMEEEERKKTIIDDEDIDGVSDIIIGRDTGDLRPMNEIQTFV
jgi:hypothetical protein